MQFSFVCPIEGCGLKMNAEAMDKEAAAVMLVNDAKKHLQETHPNLHKTDEEVNIDIRSHMVEEK
ncbi:MAG TPA: hypothetical protein VF189_02460 [Patescibacteria group bacterium]